MFRETWYFSYYSGVGCLLRVYKGVIYRLGNKLTDGYD